MWHLPYGIFVAVSNSLELRKLSEGSLSGDDADAHWCTLPPNTRINLALLTSVALRGHSRTSNRHTYHIE